MVNQHRILGDRTVSMALVGLGIGINACGGRSLDADGLPGPASGQGGANTGTNVGNATGVGNNGNNGNNGNSGNGSGNGNGANNSTGGGRTDGGSTGAVTVVTGSHSGTNGTPGGQGTCDDPYDLDDLGGSFSGFTGGVSAFIGPCNGAGPEIFFTWEASRDGAYRLHTAGSGIDTVLYRLSGSNCEARILDCNDDTNGSADSELLFEAERGERMTFVIDSYYAPGDVRLTLEQSNAPPCGPSHGELFGVGQLVYQELPLDDSTLSDPTLDACEGRAPRISFDWTAPNDGAFTFDTVGSNYDTVLVVRTICDIRSGYRCNDDMFEFQSGVVQEVERGQVLRLEIAAFSGNATPPGADVPIVALNVRE